MNGKRLFSFFISLLILNNIKSGDYMSENKIIKDGNTILEWDKNRAYKSADEVQAILQEVVNGERKSIIAAEVAKKIGEKDTA